MPFICRLQLRLRCLVGVLRLLSLPLYRFITDLHGNSCMIHFNVHTCQDRLPDACFLRDHCSEKQVLATTPMRINRISNICFVSRKHFRACLFFLRKHFRCSFGISFDIALLRTVHCFRTCSVATGRSKSLLELAFWPLGARNHCSSLLFVAPEGH